MRRQGEFNKFDCCLSTQLCEFNAVSFVCITIMSDVGVKCVFCGEETCEKFQKFTPKTLKKCITILEYRKVKPVQRSCSNAYATVEISNETSLNDSYYHSHCYKLFTAIRIPPDFQRQNGITPESAEKCDDTPEFAQGSPELSISSTSTVQTVRPTVEEASPSNNPEPNLEDCDGQLDADESVIDKDLLHSECFICKKSKKRRHGRSVPLAVNRFQTIEALKSAATEYSDIEMLEKISSFTDSSKIPYHKCCKDLYLREICKTEDSDFAKRRKASNTAYDLLCEILEEYVVRKNECIFFDHVKKEYHRLLIEQYKGLSESINDTSFSDRHLENKILETFPKKIKCIFAEKKKFLAPTSANIVACNDLFKAMSMKETIRLVGAQLREEILNSTTTKLPEDCTAEDLIKGECDYVPELLTCFLESFVLGDVSHLSQKKRDIKKNSNDLAIFSIGQDMIYAASSHKIKTSKHITLGLAVKSLCNSKRIINLLSKYGHCCSYTNLEELETELTFSTTNSSYICPEDILRRPDLNTAVAFDNFDRFVDTLNGKDTLHDTVGIIFQNIAQNEDTMPVIPSIDSEIEIVASNKTVHSNILESTLSTPRNRKRRAFEEVSFEMRPFTKKLKIATWNQLDISALNEDPTNVNTVKELDIMWMLSHKLNIPDIPMWVGYHSKILIDNSLVQKISYLTPINESPTKHSTVLKTLELSQEIAKECKAPYIQVTYDLAIARTSYCIQTQESPKFDNIFIHLGAFHIEMAFFKAIGTFIEECGLTNIMTESDLIAEGSVLGFITGKNYNRCKRLHSIMALSLQQFHFDSFLENTNVTIEESVIEYLTAFSQHKDNFPQVQHLETQNLLQLYDKYTAETLEGKHGKTAQFYAMYIDFINLYHIFIRSIRVGDLDLYFYTLGIIVCLFFYFNQQNYSRWLVFYLNQLQHINETHPGLREEIAKGSFGIRRTNKTFSRIPVDLTLEQTINGEAARRLTGIVNLTSSISARQRWARNHGVRTRIISHVLNRAGLSNCNEDLTADLHPDRLKKHQKQIKAFMHCIEQTTSPFSSSLDNDQLYNISTGQATTPEVANCLLRTVSSGMFLRDQFITECNVDPDRFHKVLKKNPVLTFASLKKKKSMKIGQKVHEVKLQRDLFGRLLALSLDTHVNLEKVLCFPITPVPLSLCHMDGSINKTAKSILIRELEKQVEEIVQPPQQLDCLIVDGFFFLNTFKQMPRSFGDLSKKILQSLVNTSANSIAIVFDRYFTPSIKDCEHTLRGYSDNNHFYIAGPQQIRTSDFSKDLKNIQFKEALVKFLIEHWAEQEMKSIIGNKTIFLNYDSCFVYKVINNEVSRIIDHELSCPDHEEADTKVVFFACQMKEASTVTIRTSDTDIVVIMLANMEHIKASVKIWVDLGVGNARRFIDISALSAQLGPLVSQALPALHALTGCDYNPAFYRRGKKRPFDILMGSATFQEAFANLGSEVHDIEESLPVMESFICHLYGLKKLADVNRARIEIFNKTYKVSDTSQPFSLNVRNYDACNLPPCQSELRQHLLRTKYIACLWRNAHYFSVSEMSPTNCGWKNVDGKLEPTWFIGNQLPEAYEDIVITPDILGDTLHLGTLSF
uniref:Uncharacterized protein LOC114335591 n=1 Tax=Diabrotica virgifera virgifera TaxID=50390 RepID=A0A6P7FYQ7_DIAVI